MEKTLTQVPYTGKRIVLFGPESTGKTTLAQQLAKHYKAPFVAEFMRTYLQEKWDKSKKTSEPKDVLPIAQGQIALENEAVSQNRPIIFCDTNVLEIATYARYYFDGFCPSEIEKAIKSNHYDHYFLTYYDVPWEADDLRDRPHDRSALFCIFEHALQSRGLSYTLLKGNETLRLANAIKTIHNLFTL